MAVSNVTRGRIFGEPVRLLVYGVEGVGKSTLAAGAPGPVFLGPEDGTFHLDVARFPDPQNWQDVLDACMSLIRDPHEHKTLVIDTLDWIEPMLWAQLCAEHRVANIEDFGYGKGYNKALDGWRQLLSLLERVRDERRMHIILLAHSQVKTWKNPEGDDFDRYILKINEKAAGICREWCDATLFANYQTFADKDSRTKRVRGISTGARLLYTQRTAAYDAKNRYDMPSELPLAWDEVWAAVQAHKPADPTELKVAIAEKLTALGDTDLTAKAQVHLTKAGDDAALLAKVNDWLTGKLIQQEDR